MQSVQHTQHSEIVDEPNVERQLVEDWKREFILSSTVFFISYTSKPFSLVFANLFLNP